MSSIQNNNSRLPLQVAQKVLAKKCFFLNVMFFVRSARSGSTQTPRKQIFNRKVERFYRQLERKTKKLKRIETKTCGLNFVL